MIQINPSAPILTETLIKDATVYPIDALGLIDF